MTTKTLTPDYCTSLHCGSLGCFYCPSCSHAYFKGKTTINGAEYKWEFNPRHGVEFEVDPNPDNSTEYGLVHQAVERWLDRFEKIKNQIQKAN